MKQLKINTLDELEKFISDESISKENRLKVFRQALKDYVFYIILNAEEPIPADQNFCLTAEMKRIINEIKTTATKSNCMTFMVLEN